MDRRDFIKCSLASTLAVSGIDKLFAKQQKQPNILWLTGEDSNISWFGCYGGVDVNTPNIDKLASEGFRYSNCFANVPVCAPMRSTWITGVYSLSMGTHPMRSRYDVPHDIIKYYPDYLHQAGYYCTNHTKTDYNIGSRADEDCWDSFEKYGWRDRKPEQPFFTVINFLESHESRAFGDVNNTAHDPEKVKLRKYHPDLPDIRKNYAHYKDAVSAMDAGVGEALEQLATDGLDEDTIVIFCTDHGGVMPRSKRFLFDSGIHSPLIVRIPEKYKHLYPAKQPGSVIDRLVSFVDMPKTWLSLAGAEVPDIMQGKIFIGSQDEGERKYHFSFRTRMDERYDNIRAVRDKRYLYIKNYMPFVPWGQHLTYLWRMAASKAWEMHHKAGKTDEITGRFFNAKPYVEELYDTKADPDSVNNIAGDQANKHILKRMRSELRNWQQEVFDSALLPETELVRRAEDNKTTIYQLVRDERLYNLSAYLDAADIALAMDSSNEKKLLQMLADKDVGLRYWAVAGLLMLDSISTESIEALSSSLNDSSDEVRAMAAWVLIKTKDDTAAISCLISMLRNRSYATLKILNILDWMDRDVNVFIPVIRFLLSDENRKTLTEDEMKMAEYIHSLSKV